MKVSSPDVKIMRTVSPITVLESLTFAFCTALAFCELFDSSNLNVNVGRAGVALEPGEKLRCIL